MFFSLCFFSWVISTNFHNGISKLIFVVVLFLFYILCNIYWKNMSSLKNKERQILERSSIFRLLDLSRLRPPPLCPRSRPFSSANLYVISENLKQVVWYQRRIQGPVKYLKDADNFYKTLHLRCLTVLWIWFSFWNKEVYSVDFSN